MKELIGKTVLGVFVSNDERALAFQTDQGAALTFGVDGDCCSESWWSDIYNFDALLGTVTDAQELELPGYNVDDGRCRQESDSVYGYRIETERGAATLAFRNSSNGYYGGSLWPAEVSSEIDPTFKQITTDWRG